jgi:hypothetical protein
MEKINDILFFDLRPWLNKFQKNYFNHINHSIEKVRPIFSQNYKIDFFRHLSERTIYCQKIIDNDLTTFCNNLFQETSNASNSLVAYKIDQSIRQLRELIINTGDIINLQNLNIANLENNSTDFQRKEATYIANYLQTALIKCDMEIQRQFHSSIDDADRLEIPDFYTRFLNQQTPENKLIFEVKPQETPIKSQTAETTGNETFAKFIKKTQVYQFAELIKFKNLTLKNQIRLIEKIMSETIPYAVAMLDFLEYPKHLFYNYNIAKEKQYTHIANCLNTSPRLVKGNFLVLNPASKEDRLRYTAPDFTNAVKSFYFSLTDKTK